MPDAAEQRRRIRLGLESAQHSHMRSKEVKQRTVYVSYRGQVGGRSRDFTLCDGDAGLCEMFVYCDGFGASPSSTARAASWLRECTSNFSRAFWR